MLREKFAKLFRSRDAFALQDGGQARNHLAQILGFGLCLGRSCQRLCSREALATVEGGLQRGDNGMQSGGLQRG